LKNDLEKELNHLCEKFSQKLEELKKELKNEVEEYKKELEEELKEKLKNFILEVSTEVSLLIVGESYLKWDSTSCSFPTLLFVFNEIISAGTPRRSQIKTRLKKRSDEITPGDLEILKARLQRYENWTYTLTAVTEPTL
jgi:hypothetical protein